MSIRLKDKSRKVIKFPVVVDLIVICQPRWKYNFLDLNIVFRLFHYFVVLKNYYMFIWIVKCGKALDVTAFWWVYDEPSVSVCSVKWWSVQRIKTTTYCGTQTYAGEFIWFGNRFELIRTNERLQRAFKPDLWRVASTLRDKIVIKSWTKKKIER